MLSRPARDSDLDACLAIEPRHLGAELVGPEKALLAWRWLLRSPSFNSGVFTADASANAEILAFGAAAFASPGFVDAELADPRPGINARVVASIAEGHPVVLDEQQLRHGNTHDGLDLVCLVGSYRLDVTHEFAIEILTTMSASFVDVHSGYRNRRLVGEPIGAVEIANYRASGIWRCVMDFGDFAEAATSRWGSDRALFLMTRKEAYASPISNSLQLFQYSEPLLNLREPDQELLKAALSGVTDEELAHCLNVHVGTVKKRWLEIYNRMNDVAPQIFLTNHQCADTQTRGKQKRHHALAYIRQHPEELRPYEIAEPPFSPVTH
jgi:hypothetical protein